MICINIFKIWYYKIYKLQLNKSQCVLKRPKVCGDVYWQTLSHSAPLSSPPHSWASWSQSLSCPSFSTSGKVRPLKHWHETSNPSTTTTLLLQQSPKVHLLSLLSRAFLDMCGSLSSSPPESLIMWVMQVFMVRIVCVVPSLSNSKPAVG